MAFSWVYECLDSWWTGGQCLLGHLTVLVNIHNNTEGSHWSSHWSTPLSLHGHLKQELPGVTHDSGFASVGIAFLPWIRVSANEHIWSEISPQHWKPADFITRAVAAQWWSLDSLAKVVLDSLVALDYLPAEERGICAIANTTCCIWINASRGRNSMIQDQGTSAPITTNFTQLSMIPWFAQLATFRSYSHGLEPSYNLDLSCYF